MHRPTGSYGLAFYNGTVDEVICALIRLSAVGNPELQERHTGGANSAVSFGTEPPEDTARVDGVPARSLSLGSP